MEINEYQRLALKTSGTKDPEGLLLNGILGLCGESGELADLFKKHKFQGHELKKDSMVDELGDICWYIAITAKGLGVNLEEVMLRNIEKLSKRYPEGFDPNRSLNRGDND